MVLQNYQKFIVLIQTWFLLLHLVLASNVRVKSIWTHSAPFLKDEKRNLWTALYTATPSTGSRATTKCISSLHKASCKRINLRVRVSLLLPIRTWLLPFLFMVSQIFPDSKPKLLWMIQIQISSLSSYYGNTGCGVFKRGVQN